VLTEAHEGMRRGVLVPALLDAVTIPLAFRRIQAANLVSSSGKLPKAGLEKLAKAIGRVLNFEAEATLPTLPNGPAVDRAPRPPAVRTKDARLPQSAKVIFGKRLVLSAPVTVGLIGIGIYAVQRQQQADVSPGQVRRNSIDGLEYVWVPPGNFMMGCSPKSDSLCNDDADPPHDVKISKGFWIGKTEVTEAAYGRFPHG